MNPSALLAHLRTSGFTIQPDGDTLIVSPASRLADDLREAICQAKPDLMALLWAENLREHFEERAAILECDGGLSRNEPRPTHARQPACWPQPWPAVAGTSRGSSRP
jgi:hypothetical protein